MDHMKKDWGDELQWIQKGIHQVDGYITTISNHYLQHRLQNDEYEDRIFDELDICWAIMNGRIVEGYDIGERNGNKDPERILIGPSLKEPWIVLAVVLRLDRHFIIKTVFPVDRERYQRYLENDERP
ncbi:DUF4258 domain-containing protein [Paenibacillus enshidis]|uniref:DUF4258 domain-containing protein n=1 Tax=Paenibacillus enshidis TaxID=1458439 RepID=A0ABV5AVE2_9BACL